MNATQLQGSILDAVEVIEGALGAGKLGKNNRVRLLKALKQPLGEATPIQGVVLAGAEGDEGGEVNIGAMVREQMSILATLKARLVAEGGDISIRDLNSGMAASTSMLSTIMRHRDELNSQVQEKAHALAVERALDRMGGGELKMFFVLLEEELGSGA